MDPSRYPPRVRWAPRGVSRREFLQWAGLGAAGLTGASLLGTRVPSALARASRRLQGGSACPSFPPQFPLWGDGGGWDQPQYYSTIQLADIDGDGRADLLARGPGGIIAYVFDTSVGQWEPTP